MPVNIGPESNNNMNNKKELSTLTWTDGELRLLDQRLLPQEIKYRICSSYPEVIAAICEMSVRGAPAIGISAAFGMVLAAREALVQGLNTEKTVKYMRNAAIELRQARPTAVNLSWAINRAEILLWEQQGASGEDIYKGLEHLALKIHEEDLVNNRLLGAYGADLLPQKSSVLTHCNAGALATGGYGTALGVIRSAVDQGKDIHVYVDETRPLFQGARITAFELIREGIQATLITDSCAGHLMAQDKIDLVIVGADRIAANGDTANKIGTYSLAVLADYHNIPFYIAAPLSTIDPSIESGKDIIIEERCSSEVTHFNNKRLAPQGIRTYNPAFDITPAALISAIITEIKVLEKPDRQKIMGLYSQ